MYNQKNFNHMECDVKTVFDSIEVCPGKTFMPGIRRRIYFAPKADIVTWPKLPKITGANGQKMEDLAKLDGNFTLAEDKYWKCMDLKDEASNVTFDTVGDEGSKLVQNTATAILAGQSDEVKGFARQAIKTNMVFLYQQRDGKFCVLGNEMFSTKIKAAGDTGAEATAATTSTYTIEAYDECPIPTYTGKLYIASGKYIDCATGNEEKDPDPDPGE